MRSRSEIAVRKMVQILVGANSASFQNGEDVELR